MLTKLWKLCLIWMSNNRKMSTVQWKGMSNIGCKCKQSQKCRQNFGNVCLIWASKFEKSQKCRQYFGNDVSSRLQTIAKCWQYYGNVCLIWALNNRKMSTVPWKGTMSNLGIKRFVRVISPFFCVIILAGRSVAFLISPCGRCRVRFRDCFMIIKGRRWAITRSCRVKINKLKIYVKLHRGVSGGGGGLTLRKILILFNTQK